MAVKAWPLAESRSFHALVSKNKNLLLYHGNLKITSTSFFTTLRSPNELS